MCELWVEPGGDAIDDERCRTTEGPNEKEFPILVLSRKVNERIIIAGNITITVVEFRHGKVRIGVEAPADVPVHREEIAEKCKHSLAAGAPRAGRVVSPVA